MFPEAEDEDNIALTTQTRYSTFNAHAHHDPRKKKKNSGRVMDVG